MINTELNYDFPTLASELRKVSKEARKKTSKTKEVYEYVLNICKSIAEEGYDAVLFMLTNELDKSLSFSESDLTWLLEKDGFEVVSRMCVKWSREENYELCPKSYYLSASIACNKDDSSIV